MKDEVVVITGASAGLGRATAREFGRHGAKIGLIARGREGLEGAKREIESAGGSAMVLALDVADANAMENAAAAVEAEFGPIDIWVNNAMASVFSPVKEMKADEYKRVTEVISWRCLRYPRSLETHVASQSRNHRSGWIGLGLSKYSLAIRLLRR